MALNRWMDGIMSRPTETSQQKFGENPANIAQDLEQAAEMLQFAAAQIRAGKGTMEHFGD